MAAPDRVTVQFVALGLQPDLVSRTPEGVNPNGVARRDLERYYQVLSDELARLALTEDEATVLVAALNGTIHGPQDYRLMWVGVEDHLRYAAEDREADAAARATLSADELDEREDAQSLGDRLFGPGPGRDEAAARLGTQGAAVLVAKLRSLSPGGAMAIVDAVERYFLAEGGHLARLARVGLVRP